MNVRNNHLKASNEHRQKKKKKDKLNNLPSSVLLDGLGVGIGAEMGSETGEAASSSVVVVVVARGAETGVEAGSSVRGEEVVAIGAETISPEEVEPAPASVDDRALSVKIPS